MISCFFFINIYFFGILKKKNDRNQSKCLKFFFFKKQQMLNALKERCQHFEETAEKMKEWYNTFENTGIELCNAHCLIQSKTDTVIETQILQNKKTQKCNKELQITKELLNNEISKQKNMENQIKELEITLCQVIFCSHFIFF